MVGEKGPSDQAVEVNAQQLADYAAICQVSNCTSN
jgi:fructose-bisphosphate aldolase class 1